MIKPVCHTIELIEVVNHFIVTYHIKWVATGSITINGHTYYSSNRVLSTVAYSRISLGGGGEIYLHSRSVFGNPGCTCVLILLYVQGVVTHFI